MILTGCKDYKKTDLTAADIYRTKDLCK